MSEETTVWKQKMNCTNPICKHKWETKSKMIWVSCPSCHRPIKRVKK